MGSEPVIVVSILVLIVVILALSPDHHRNHRLFDNDRDAAKAGFDIVSSIWHSLRMTTYLQTGCQVRLRAPSEKRFISS